MATLARRSIRIHVLGTVIALRGLAYGITFAAAIGIAVVVLHGDRVLDMADRFGRWVGSLKKEQTPSPDRPPGSEPSATVRKETVEQVAAVGVVSGPAYRASPRRLDGRPLPVRVAPDPHSTCKLQIPSGATGILATGPTAYYDEPVLLLFYRKVLWREVTYRGEQGWVADYFIEPWGTYADDPAALPSLPPEGARPKVAPTC